MTTTIERKSQFDTGNWSDVNGLPGQDDIISYLEHLFTSNPNRCFTRRGLMDEVAKEFGIPAVAQEAEGPKSHTAGYYTRMTYLITDSIQGKRRADGNAFAKRIGYGVYQHISGDGVVPKELRTAASRPKLPKREVESCRVSVRILKSLQDPKWQDPTTILCELGGRQWSDEIVEAAINLEFNLND